MTASELARPGELAARREERAAYHRARYGVGDRADMRHPAEGLAPAADRRPEPWARFSSAEARVTMRWLARSIQDRIETLAMEDLKIEGGREMLAEIEETTWGVGLREVSGERYVTLPAGTPVVTSFIVDGRPYLKLSRE